MLELKYMIESQYYLYAVVECGLVFGAEKVLFLIKFEDYEIYFMFLGTTVGAFNDFSYMG